MRTFVFYFIVAVACSLPIGVQADTLSNQEWPEASVGVVTQPTIERVGESLEGDYWPEGAPVATEEAIVVDRIEEGSLEGQYWPEGSPS